MMKKIKVLIVDDDPMVADINKKFTEAVDGFSVVGIAGNGNKAIELVTKLQPDLIILDIYMPEVDGMEVLGLLRKEDADVDVILITAANDSEMISRVMRYGAIDYIIKPFKFDRYRNTLEAYRDFNNKMNRQSSFSQAELDKFFSAKMAKTNEHLPKNMHGVTLDSIVNLLSAASEALSADEVASEVGISRVTARRYLDYLVLEGKLQMVLEYMPVGRPIHRFKMK
ncbi:response regulator [Pelosinus propionicus]|uniref:Transcriptional regulatory protein n=1 Tax=Pelosinus propionicus DSM 13327 TaxID=1123291 RepID=A0A1I4KGN8_9FIRM|nr:response regulator [Pelosinus propionicus]SFL77781.1 two-component system, CitB family, response regulator DctR [Pelosinus propionicus DSM 13327]